MKPAIIRSVVVLPQPDGPSNDTNSPCRSVRSTSATAATGRSFCRDRSKPVCSLAFPPQHEIASQQAAEAMPTITSVASSSKNPSAARCSKLPSSLMSMSITDMVRVFGPYRNMAVESSRVAGMNTSSHAPTRPRFISGAMTLRIASNLPPPRIRTASSISGLIARIAASALA
jgi:hypothetical protein